MIKDIAYGLRAVAWPRPDGISEAVELAGERPVQAVQQHPEVMDDTASEWLFQQIVYVSRN